MSKEEIALQLTLKSIDKMATPLSAESKGTSSGYNSAFSKQVCDFYNYLYNNLNNTITM